MGVSDEAKNVIPLKFLRKIKSKNPRILAPLIILEQTLKYKSCRVLKMGPNSYLFCFLTSSGSTQ
jgi:hypothetical protein